MSKIRSDVLAHILIRAEPHLRLDDTDYTRERQDDRQKNTELPDLPLVRDEIESDEKAEEGDDVASESENPHGDAGQSRVEYLDEEEGAENEYETCDGSTGPETLPCDREFHRDERRDSDGEQIPPCSDIQGFEPVPENVLQKRKEEEEIEGEHRFEEKQEEETRTEDQQVRYERGYPDRRR